MRGSIEMLDCEDVAGVDRKTTPKVEGGAFRLKAAPSA
jgi:hypothetical protein